MFLIKKQGLFFLCLFEKSSKSKKKGWQIFGVALILLLMVIQVIYNTELDGNHVVNQLGITNTLGNMEGKEVRFGLFFIDNLKYME